MSDDNKGVLVEVFRSEDYLVSQTLCSLLDEILWLNPSTCLSDEVFSEPIICLHWLHLAFMIFRILAYSILVDSGHFGETTRPIIFTVLNKTQMIMRTEHLRLKTCFDEMIRKLGKSKENANRLFSQTFWSLCPSITCYNDHSLLPCQCFPFKENGQPKMKQTLRLNHLGIWTNFKQNNFIYREIIDFQKVTL